MGKATLERELTITSRELDFLSEKELVLQIGWARDLWPLALLKELIDNALDACEKSGVPPRIEVAVGPDSVAVQDNGPGLPKGTLDASLDYKVRASDNAYVVSPTRGQLGNALKCVWAAPFVADGESGRCDVLTPGKCYRIEVNRDAIEQKPLVVPTEIDPGPVKNGTLVRMHWPGVASFLDGRHELDCYNGEEELDAEVAVPEIVSAAELVCAYAAFNPHATFALDSPDEEFEFRGSPAGWGKWVPTDLPCPHWYTPERLRALVAAMLAKERRGGRAWTVREFLARNFAGMKGSAKQQAVCSAASLSGARLSALVRGNDVDMPKVKALLEAMQQATRPVKSAALGTIGELHLKRHLCEWYGVALESARYKCRKRRDGEPGPPFVLEVAFGVREDESYSRTVVAGVNWSPSLGLPFPQLPELLGEVRLDDHDPVVLLVHLACPRPDYTDPGKGHFPLHPTVRKALAECVRSVAKGWKAAKRQADRDDRLSQRQLSEMRRAKRKGELSVKEAVRLVMERAYLAASDNNTLPANARQIMYAARPLVQALTGGKCWKSSSYFTQTLLPNFLEAHQQLTADWDVVFDARGHMTEPHHGPRVDLGTVAVRRYTASWRAGVEEMPSRLELSASCPTAGPANRYRFVLFVEKEGFDALLERAEVARRYDVAIMSTKGMSVTACRQLVERLTEEGVTILVLHDFDKAGFSILHTLRSDTRRYAFRTTPRVIDLGLRLQDVQDMQLQDEEVTYKRAKRDPRLKLRECGATDGECDFLVRTARAPWSGRRVELNAMVGRQFVEFLERKFEQHGVRKVVPDAETLGKAYRLACRKLRVQRAMDEALRSAKEAEIEVPTGLAAEVQSLLAEHPTLPWDEALWRVARRLAKGAGDVPPV